MKLATAICMLFVSAFAAGCGSSAEAENCIILSNGQKLCGGEAKSYCDGFIKGDPNFDPQTIDACHSVGMKDGGIHRYVENARRDRELKKQAAHNRDSATVQKAMGRTWSRKWLSEVSRSKKNVDVDTNYSAKPHKKINRNVIRKICGAFDPKRAHVTIYNDDFAGYACRDWVD